LCAAPFGPFRQNAPDPFFAIFCPRIIDTHPAHRAARALVAVALYFNEMHTPVVDYWTPWTPVSPNAYCAYDRGTARWKRRALRAYVSQQLEYAEFAFHLERAYAFVLPEMIDGHHAAVGGAGVLPAAGVELFRVWKSWEDSENDECNDPILTVLGILEGILEARPPFRKITPDGSEFKSAARRRRRNRSSL
jgi:hypothetical protein